MKTISCLRFHEFFGFINNRLSAEAALLIERHLETCRRCQEELNFTRKMNQSIISMQEQVTRAANPEIHVQHISEQIQEKYFQGSLGKHEKNAVHKHLAACDDCLHGFGDIAKVTLASLSEKDRTFLEQVEAAYVPDRLADYRRYFMVTNGMTRTIDSLRLQWQRINWAYKLGIASVGIIVLAFLSQLTFNAHTVIEKANTTYVDFQNNQPLGDGELRPTGEFKFKFNTRAEKPAVTFDINALSRALEIEPNSSDLNHKIGTLYFFRGEMELAERHYRRALELDNNAKIHNDLALIYFDRRDYSQALNLLDKAISLDPELREPYYNRAVILELLKDKESAIAAWKKYLEKDTDQDSEWKRVATDHLDELSR